MLLYGERGVAFTVSLRCNRHVYSHKDARCARCVLVSDVEKVLA